MILQTIPLWVAALMAFTTFATFVLLAFCVAYAKRDVSIDLTVLEIHH
jgi:hypothetical protein